MAPKQRIVVSGSNGSQKGFFGTAYDEITSPENTTIVRSVLVFAVSARILEFCFFFNPNRF